MTRFDRLFFVFVLIPVFITTYFCLFGWVAPLLGLDVLAMRLTGLTLGCLFVFVWLPDLIRNLFSLPLWVFMCIYGLFSIVLIILMEGIPLMHTLMSIIAGIYIGRRIRFMRGDEAALERITCDTNKFTLGTLLVVCIIGGAMALTSPNIGQDLGTLFGSDVNFSLALVWIMIVGGTVFLAYVSWFFVRWFARISYGWFSHEEIQNTFTHRD